MAEHDSQTLEVELKYELEQNRLDSIQNIRRWLDLNATRCGENELDNTYFDTKDQQLRKYKIGLRIRRWQNQLEQTLKFAGAQTGAMTERPEFNLNIYSDWPDLSSFLKCENFTAYWPKNLSLASIEAALMACFNVRFTRTTWSFIQADSENPAKTGFSAEVALDLGWIAAGTQRIALSELEWELKSGSSQLMQQAGEAMAAKFQLKPGLKSKAQRGFELLNTTQV